MRKTSRFENLSFLLRGCGCNANNLEPYMPHSRNTIQRRLRSPEELTLGDLLGIIRSHKVTWEQIIDAIKDEGKPRRNG